MPEDRASFPGPIATMTSQTEEVIMRRKLDHWWIALPCIAVFSIYWAFTLLYVSPDNYVRIRLADTMSVFGTFFGQRWGFFAPPPRADIQVYFVFVDKETEEEALVLEGLMPVYRAKQETAPFNMNAQVLDYILASAAHSVNESVVACGKLSRAAYPDEDDEFHCREAWDIMSQHGQRLASYQTLENYGHLIAANHGIDARKHDLVLRLCQADIVSFSQRMAGATPDGPRVAKVFFESPRIDLATISSRGGQS